MSLTESEQHLLDQYTRLRAAAQAVVDGAEAAGNPQQPKVMLEPHLLRRLRREISGEPQPIGAWMSVS